jgi:ankyrin repeat protein
LEKGADINARDVLARTTLHYAASGGHADVANALLDQGADINARNIEGWTPLHEAARRGDLDVVKTLLKKGADTRIQNNDRQVAEDLARKSNAWTVVGLSCKAALHVDQRQR